MNQKLTITVPELATALNIGRNAAYALFHSEGFPAVQIGKRLVIPIESLHEWLRIKGMEPKQNDAV